MSEKVLAIIFIIFLILLGLGIKSGSDRREKFKEGCKETELYVLTKGGFKRAYDCSDKTSLL